MDKITISDLNLRCIVGVNPAERDILQEVRINIDLFCDLKQAGRTDNIADTVDYKSLKQQVRAFVEPSKFCLLEALAEGIADCCLQCEHVSRVRVKVEKPGALRFARTVSVEIER